MKQSTKYTRGGSALRSKLMATPLDIEVVWWPRAGEPKWGRDVTALSHVQAEKLVEVAEVMRCQPADLLCALALAWLEMAQPDAPELNVQAINTALNRFITNCAPPRFSRHQVTTESVMQSASSDAS